MRRRKSFTLIELLIVVAIIAILAGMLLPALNKAKETARSIACVNNLRQLGMFWHEYSSNFNDYLLPSVSHYQEPAQKLRWHEKMVHAGSGLGMPGVKEPSSSNWADQLPHITKANIRNAPAKFFTCPSSLNHPLVARNGYIVALKGPFILGYGYNMGIDPVSLLGMRADQNALTTKDFWDKRIAKLSQAKNCGPASIPVMGDNWKASAVLNSVTTQQIVFLDNGVLSVQYFKAHSGGANMLWGDGHIGVNNKQDLNLTPWYRD